MSASSSPEPLNLTTTSLHRTALSAVSLPAYPPPSHPLTPPSASIPQSKLIPKTRFIVDSFKNADLNFSVSYFLSHFHSDHYTGLTPQWTKGIIYCSETTALLLHQILKIPQPFIFPLPISKPVLIDGAEVSMVDANHCPGAVQFLFKVPNLVKNGGETAFSGKNDNSVVKKYVHTGDFRYCVEMKNERLLCDFIGADAVFLDTTYCNPKFVFPSQDESIDYIIRVIDERSRMEDESVNENVKKVLFLVATYVVGKERILLEISRRCKRKIHVSSKKMAVLCALGLGESGVFTEKELESDVHVVGWNVLGETWPYFRPNFVKMKEIVSEKGYSKVVGFVPTGWTHEIKQNKFSVRRKDVFEIHLVPYSEHSNYDELREYVKFLKPKRVIPIVGADAEKIDSKHAHAMQKHFAGLVDEMAVKQAFLMGFIRGDAREVHDAVEMANPLLSGIVETQDDYALSIFRTDNELQSEKNCSPPQEETVPHGIEDLRESDLEKYMQELQDCLPSWVTRSQMLTILSSCDGNVVEAVSKFYEHETEFHEEVLPSTSFSCTSQEGSEIQPSLPFESPSAKSVHRTDDVSFSQHLKLSSSTSSKSSGKSPAKRKRNPDSKASKRSRAGSTQKTSDSKQYSITKFFSKKVPVIFEDSKIQTEPGHSDDDQSRSPANTTELYKEDLDKFIQIVNGGESLRSYAATILEKAKGNINMALDIYYSDNTGNSNEIKDALESNKVIKSESASRHEELPEGRELQINSALPKVNMPGNYVSLPPERYSPMDHACWMKEQPAPYLHIARTFELVEEEKGKLKSTSMLCNMFRSLLVLSPEDVLPAVYLCTNKIAPDHENMVNLNLILVVA